MPTGRAGEVALTCLKLGLTSFGGPVAHMGYFRAEFVERRRWLDDSELADIIALCQFLPGPASSQTVFVVGMRRAGLAGAVAGSLCFLLPSAVLMIAFATGVGALGGLEAGWLQGLRIAAVAVVAQAVAAMASKLCPDTTRRLLAAGVAASLLAFPGAFAQVAAIVFGAAVGRLGLRSGPSQPPPEPGRPATPWGPAVVLVAFVALLAALPAVARLTGSPTLGLIDAFYRSGALVFGGGHVVLPLLRAEIVGPGWITDEAFLAGYGAAQAVPGPLFSFAGYLGTAMGGGGADGVLLGVACLMAIFLPGWLLVAGALPFWDRLRGNPAMRSAVAGANAAVVGVLAAALWDPVIAEGIRTPADIGAAAVAFVLLERLRVPPWVVVAMAAAAGQWLLPAG